MCIYVNEHVYTHIFTLLLTIEHKKSQGLGHRTWRCIMWNSLRWLPSQDMQTLIWLNTWWYKQIKYTIWCKCIHIIDDVSLLSYFKLPSDSYKYLVWNNIEEHDIQGSQLHCPRVRKGNLKKGIFLLHFLGRFYCVYVCLHHCSIAMKRYHDQGNNYKRKYVIDSLLIQKQKPEREEGEGREVLGMGVGGGDRKRERQRERYWAWCVIIKL